MSVAAMTLVYRLVERTKIFFDEKKSEFDITRRKTVDNDFHELQSCRFYITLVRVLYVPQSTITLFPLPLNLCHPFSKSLTLFRVWHFYNGTRTNGVTIGTVSKRRSTIWVERFTN